jgi:excisionase family DNA binding protein
LPTLVTVADAARRLAVSLRTLRAIIAAGHLPVVRVSARRIAVDMADLAEFIERRRERAGGR